MNRAQGDLVEAVGCRQQRWVATVCCWLACTVVTDRATAVSLLTSLPPADEASPAAVLASAAVRADGTPLRLTGSEEARARVRAEAWRLPLAFEPADGRSPVDAGFRARGPGYAVYVGPGGLLLSLSGEAKTAQAGPVGHGDGGIGRRRPAGGGGASGGLLRVQFAGAATDSEPVMESPLPGRIHRILGNDPRRWQHDLRPHGRVRYRDVYPGIDVAYYGNGRELEYDLIVQPGGCPEQARLRIEGAASVTVDPVGQLRIDTGKSVLIQRKPLAYQEGPQGRQPVAASYRQQEDGTVGFQLGDWDRRLPLVIDPVLSYATFVGGLGFDECWDVAVDTAGAAYVVGETESSSFSEVVILSTNAFQRFHQGGRATVAGDAFVGKLLPDGSAFEWLTYLGGSDLETAFSVAVAANGEPVVGGFTSSTNFPVSANAYLRVMPGRTNQFSGSKPLAGFVTRLSADGSGLVASTLFGGGGEDQIIDLGLLADGSVVAVGSTSSTNLPVTSGAAQPTLGGIVDGFAVRFSADLSGLLWATYVGGSGRDSAEGLAVDPVGGVLHVTGITLSTNFPVRAAVQGTSAGLADGFLAGYGLADGVPTYATYLGGENTDYAYRAALGDGGSVWIVGETYSTQLIGVGGVQSTNAGGGDGFALRVAGDGSAVQYGTFVGGLLEDVIWDVAVAGSGAVHLAGITYSKEFTGISTNTSLVATNAGLGDILIARLEPDGTLTSSFYGGLGDDLAYAVAVDSAGNGYLAGRVRSVLFPVSGTNVAQSIYGGGLGDGFVMKLAEAPVLAAKPAAEGGLVLSWTAPNPGFVLESAPDSSPSASWALAPQAPQVEGGRHVVRVQAVSSNQVFRLRWAR